MEINLYTDASCTLFIINI